MKLNAYSPVNSHSSTSRTVRFSASNSSNTDLTKNSGSDSFSFTFRAPALEKESKLQNLAGELRKIMATPAYKAYEKDVQEFEEKADRFHWEDPEAEDDAYAEIIEKHDDVIQKVNRLNDATSEIEQDGKG